MKIMHPVLLLLFGVFPLGASQALQKSLVQTTARELIEIPKTTFLGSLCLSAVAKSKRAVDREAKEEFNKHQTLIQALTDLTDLPKELIGIIALYNQTTLFVRDAVRSEPRSVEVISPAAVAVGCEDGSINMVEMVEGRILQKLCHHTAPVHVLCYSPNYHELLSLSTLDGHVPSYLSVECPPRENMMQIKVHAVACEQQARPSDETLRVWCLCAEPFFGPRGYVHNVSTAHSSIEGKQTWNLTNELKPDAACKNEAEKKSITEGVATMRAAGTKAGIICERVWSSVPSSGGAAPCVKQERDSTTYWFREAADLPQGDATSHWYKSVPENHDIVGWSSGDVVLGNNTTGKVELLRGHVAAVRILRLFHGRSGKGYIASGSDDGTIKIWEIDTRKCVQTLVGHAAPIRALSLSLFTDSQGGYVVSISDDGTLRKWSLDV